jgi:signal transduction histidine kinase
MYLKEFKEIELFTGLDDDEMSCDIEGEYITYQAGELMWQEGDEARYFMIILEGTFEIYRVIKGQKLHISLFQKGMTGGELALLAGTPHPGYAAALTDVTIFQINENNFWLMLADCKNLRRRILKNMAERLQEINQLSYQREKLISLGTMAAGLAHELNNPASAARRASQNLVKTLDSFDIHSSEILKKFIFKEWTGNGYPFQPIFDQLNLDGVSLNSIARSEREDELIDWLEELDIEEAFDMAPTLVSVGYTRDILESFSDKLIPEQVTNFLKWLTKEVEIKLLACELEVSTSRISTLVTAVKEYSYMDQGGSVQTVDLHKSLDNTIIMLNHKSNLKHIRFSKEYGKNIPLIAAFGAELNQVWTNLLDNAIDAVGDKDGQITIRTYMDTSCSEPVVGVEIIDNGSGIPAEIQNRIFEPFFTTKGPGQGTGIGLEISHRIIVNQHKGSIEVESKPGCTKFSVFLPVTL